MTAWKVNWRDTNGHHDVSYTSMNAVLDHVGYCLSHGKTITGIHPMLSGGNYSTCIFKSIRQTNIENNCINKKKILEVMERDGSVIVTDLVNILELPYRNEPMKRTAVRSMLYQLANKGLVEPIEGSRPTRWKLKGSDDE